MNDKKTPPGRIDVRLVIIDNGVYDRPDEISITGIKSEEERDYINNLFSQFNLRPGSYTREGSIYLNRKVIP